MAAIPGNEARQDGEYRLTASTFRPTNRQRFQLTAPTAQPPSSLTVNRIAVDIWTVWLMLLAADLRLQRGLDVRDVGLMTIACVNQIEIVLLGCAKVDNRSPVLVMTLWGHSFHFEGDA